VNFFVSRPIHPWYTDVLDGYLQEDDDDDVDQTSIAVPEIVKNLKRKHDEMKPYDEIIVEDAPFMKPSGGLGI